MVGGRVELRKRISKRRKEETLRRKRRKKRINEKR